MAAAFALIDRFCRKIAAAEAVEEDSLACQVRNCYSKKAIFCDLTLHEKAVVAEGCRRPAEGTVTLMAAGAVSPALRITRT